MKRELVCTVSRTQHEMNSCPLITLYHSGGQTTRAATYLRIHVVINKSNAFLASTNMAPASSLRAWLWARSGWCFKAASHAPRAQPCPPNRGNRHRIQWQHRTRRALSLALPHRGNRHRTQWQCSLGPVTAAVDLGQLTWDGGAVRVPKSATGRTSNAQARAAQHSGQYAHPRRGRPS